MKRVKQIKILPGLTVRELVEQMKDSSVLGAGRVGEAASIITEMFSDERFTTFLSIAGPMVPGGLRNLIGDLVSEGFIDAIVTTGANIVHDIIEALGFRHVVGTFSADDAKLRRRRIGRIGDIYVEQAAFEALEKFSYRVLNRIPETSRQRITLGRLLQEIASTLTDENSILVKCRAANVPVFAPAFLDSMIGLNLWTYSQTNKLVIDELQDMNDLMQMGLDAKKSGAIMLGGGVPKHHMLIANLLREGVDLAVQITTDRPEPGGLSGATLEEAISWGKVREEGRYATVICDATICFPLIISAVIDEVNVRRKRREDKKK